MKRKIIIILCIFAFVMVGIVFAIKIYTESFSKKFDDLEIGSFDLASLQNGDYLGECQIFPVKVKVKVTILNHEMTNVEIIEHVNGQGQAAEAIIDKVIEEQSLQVQVISGATYSSKVILKAIEIALSN